MVHRGLVVFHLIFDYFFKALPNRCNRYPMATMQGGWKGDRLAVLSQSQWIFLGQSEVSSSSLRGERRGRGKAPVMGTVHGVEEEDTGYP